MSEEGNDLKELAGLYGVETSYQDAMGRRVDAEADSLVAVLRALGATVEGPADAAEALRARREELDRLVVEPVVVLWDGRNASIELRTGAHPGGSVACRLDFESGERCAWDREISALPVSGDRRMLALPENLPVGYHRLRVEIGGQTSEALVISAPERAYTGDGGDGKPLWGIFLPLYALETRDSWGAGDFTDFERLAEWAGGLGGGVVATLPLLAAFLDDPFEPSPYAPASRLFWNELYLDPRRVPEMEDCPEARELLRTPDFEREVRALRAERQVDYGRLIALKRRVLEELARHFFEHASPDRRDAFDDFVTSHPELDTYAAFRAVGERRGGAWQTWPERLREGRRFAPADYDEDDRRYHLWVQWILDGQVGAMAKEARRRGPGLYLDLPLGVHGSAYDVWRYRHLFAEGVAAGAPPDSFFTQGQNWGFPPLQPERLRESGYDYLIASLRHHLRHAGLLRLDHVMQLQRLFWIPSGMEAAQGVYVRYPAEEMFAVLAIESHRHQAMIVGENLGTVPPEINEAMDRHETLGMYVVQYELQPGSQGLREPPARSAASLNTHDMPTFRSFWEARDVQDLQELGFFDERQAREERERRGQIREQMLRELPDEERRDDGAAYRAVLRKRLEHLAASPARMVLVNLEDLWGETEPQNVPGTHTERPNWRRKARLPFEELSTKPEVLEALRRVDELRRERG